MFFKKAAIPLLGLLSLAQALPAELTRKDECPALDPNVVGGVIEIHIETQVQIIPVEINNYYEFNTEIIIYDGLTLTVTDAPTQLSTIVTATITDTVTSTVTVTVGSPITAASSSASGIALTLTETLTDTLTQTITTTLDSGEVATLTETLTTTTTTTTTTTETAAATSAGFVLAFDTTTGARRAIQRHYIGDAGMAVTNVSSAVVFNFDSNQHITSNGRYISAGYNATNAPFALSSAIQTISTIFFNNGGLLAWENSVFFNSFVEFYFLAGIVGSSFDHNIPNGGLVIELLIIPTSSLSTASTTAVMTGTGVSSGVVSATGFGTSAYYPTGNTTVAVSSSMALSATDSSALVSGAITTSAAGSSNAITTSAPYAASNSTTAVGATGTGSAAATPSGFVLSLVSSNSTNSRRALSYIGEDGVVVASISDAIIFHIDIYFRISNNGRYISIPRDATSALFSLSSTIQDISTTFSNPNGALTWENSIFFNGVAQFYISADGIVGSFFDGNLPAGGSSIELGVVPMATSSTAAATTAPSTSAAISSAVSSANSTTAAGTTATGNSTGLATSASSMASSSLSIAGSSTTAAGVTETDSSSMASSTAAAATGTDSSSMVSTAAVATGTDSSSMASSTAAVATGTDSSSMASSTATGVVGTISSSITAATSALSSASFTSTDIPTTVASTTGTGSSASTSSASISTSLSTAVSVASTTATSSSSSVTASISGAITSAASNGTLASAKLRRHARFLNYLN